MAKKTTRIGGFAAQNSGAITNCYSTVELRVNGVDAGGFVGENSGTISKSFCGCKFDRLAGGFVGIMKGKQEDSCYFFHNSKGDDSKLKKLSDSVLGQPLREIKNAQDAQRLGYDTDTVFEYTDGKVPLRFRSDRWMFESGLLNETGNVVHITTAKQLFKLAKLINGETHEFADAHILLENDLNLGGREWTPIGLDRTSAFTGVFDGGGHTVKNFVVKDKSVQDKGFFGFLKGKVYNLTVDCILKGGLCAGGIAARCEGGTIACCCAMTEIRGKAENIGGLVGRNSGEIFQSYAGGTVSVTTPTWWMIALPVLPVAAAACVLIVLYIGDFSNSPIFAPVPYDPYAVIDSEASTVSQASGNFASFQFEQNIDVNLSTGLCKFNFKNPGESNHNIVVELQFTDSQAVKIMGSTGRVEKEQKKIENTLGYNPDTYRVAIAKSGAIRPGYILESLPMVEQPNGAKVPPGTYNAMVYLVFYDVNTNDRAMLESQLPVVITVHE